MEWLNEILKDQKIIDDIVKMVPEDFPEGLTVISMVIDKYAKDHGRSSRDTWNIMHKIADIVCDECGDYLEEL